MGFPTGDSIRAKRWSNGGSNSGYGSGSHRHNWGNAFQDFGMNMLFGNSYHSGSRRYGYGSNYGDYRSSRIREERADYWQDGGESYRRQGYYGSGYGYGRHNGILGSIIGDITGYGDRDSDYRRPRYRYEDERRYRGREENPRDLNHDGRVTRDERELFDAVDRDSDGRLSREERRALKELDRNRDGKLDRPHRRSRYEDGGYEEAPMRSRHASVSWEDGQPVFRDERPRRAAYVPDETPADRPAATLPVLTDQAIERMKADGLTVRELGQILTSADQQDRDLVSDARLRELIADAKDGALDGLRNTRLVAEGGSLRDANDQARQLLSQVKAMRAERGRGEGL